MDNGTGAKPIVETPEQTNRTGPTAHTGTDAQTNLLDAPTFPTGTKNVPHLTALPSPTTTVAKEFHKIPSQEQHTSCAQLHTFLSSGSKNLVIFNCVNNPPTTALVNIPKSNMARVVYGIGYGTALIGGVSPLANKLLVLSGDGASATHPTVLLLPDSVADNNVIKIPNNVEFDTKRTTANGENYPMFKNSGVTKEKDMMKLMPIPTFFAYDGFKHDLEVLTVYNQVATLANAGNPDIVALLALLKGCMVSRTQWDPNTYIPVTTFMATVLTIARTWGRDKFKTIFPSLNRTIPVNLELSSLETTLATLLQILKPQLVGKDTTTSQQQPGPKESKFEDKFGMRKTEIELCCKYCGLQLY